MLSCIHAREWPPKPMSNEVRHQPVDGGTVSQSWDVAPIRGRQPESYRCPESPAHQSTHRRANHQGWPTVASSDPRAAWNNSMLDESLARLKKLKSTAARVGYLLHMESHGSVKCRTAYRSSGLNTATRVHNKDRLLAAPTTQASIMARRAKDPKYVQPLPATAGRCQSPHTQPYCG